MFAHAEHKNEHSCLEVVDDAIEEIVENRELFGDGPEEKVKDGAVRSGESGSGSTPPAAPSTGGSSTGGDVQLWTKGTGIQGKWKGSTMSPFGSFGN